MTVSRSQPSIEHSATPWELSPQGYIMPTHKNPCAMLKLTSPWIEGAWDDDPEAAANAAFIVEAVNNYAALKARVAELEVRLVDAEAALRSIAEGNLGDASWQANYETIKQVARNAISHAGPVARDGER